MAILSCEMLRLSLGVMTMDRIKKEHIRRTAKVGRFGHKITEARCKRCRGQGDMEEYDSLRQILEEAG